MGESWRDIPGYEGAYQVSNLGRVRSMDRPSICRSRNGKLFIRILKGKILRPQNSGGYLFVKIGANNARYVHDLVLTAFVGARPHKQEAMHLNHNRGDNRLLNLEWGTKQENMQMSSRDGRLALQHLNFGATS